MEEESACHPENYLLATTCLVSWLFCLPLWTRTYSAIRTGHRLHDPAGDLRPRAEAELVAHLLNVTLGGALADAELVRDLTVRCPLRDEDGDLALARGERRRRADRPRLRRRLDIVSREGEVALVRPRAKLPEKPRRPAAPQTWHVDSELGRGGITVARPITLEEKIGAALMHEESGHEDRRLHYGRRKVLGAFAGRSDGHVKVALIRGTLSPRHRAPSADVRNPSVAGLGRSQVDPARELCRIAKVSRCDECVDRGVARMNDGRAIFQDVREPLGVIQRAAVITRQERKPALRSDGALLEHHEGRARPQHSHRLDE